MEVLMGKSSISMGHFPWLCQITRGYTPHIYRQAVEVPEMLDFARKELSVAEAAVKDALRIFRECGHAAAEKWALMG